MQVRLLPGVLDVITLAERFSRTFQRLEVQPETPETRGIVPRIIWEAAMSDRIPTYRRKKTSARVYGVVTLPDGIGGRRDGLLGRYGTKESRQQYAAIIAEWEARGRRLPEAVSHAGLTVAELVSRFWSHAEVHYRRLDGTPSQELTGYQYSLRPLVHLYGDLTAADFGPLKLKAVRQIMVVGYDHPQYGAQEALSRAVVNHRVQRIVRVFKLGDRRGTRPR